MSKKKLKEQLKQKNSQLNLSEANNIIEIFINGISKALKNGKSVQIKGVGRWYLKKLKENYNARNPKTNEIIYKPERVKVRFKPSKKLDKIINE